MSRGGAGDAALCDAGPMDTQDAPIEDGHDEATVSEKIAGVAQQMRGDAAVGHVDDLRAMARQRLEEAQLPSDDDTVDRVLGAVGPSSTASTEAASAAG